MIKKVTLFTLDYCEHCKKAKLLLDQERVKYTNISCEDSPEACDELEKLLGVFNYPIAKVSVDNDSYYFHIASKSKDLEPRPVGKKSSIQGVINVETMVTQIKNI